MKINKKQLDLCLKVIGNIVEDNNVIPVLSNVFFNFKEKLNLVTNSNDIVFNYLIDTEENFDNILINCSLLQKSISCFEDEYIQLDKIDKKIKIKGKNKQVTINVQEETFPNIPEYQKNQHIRLDKKLFYNNIINTIFAVATSDIKIELSGVLFDVKKDSVNFVSTDGSRLAKNGIKQNNNFEIKKIIPVKVLNELIRIIPLLDIEFIDIYFSEGKIIFEIDNLKIISRVIEGNYPDYEMLIPDNFDFNVEVNKKELLQALKLSTIFSDNGLKDVVLYFKENELEVFSNSGKRGESCSKINIENKNEKEIKFNHDFLLQAINNVKDSLIFFIRDNMILLKNKDDENYINILMSLKQ